MRANDIYLICVTMIYMRANDIYIYISLAYIYIIGIYIFVCVPVINIRW
jgi:hypothetical protein